MTLLASSRFRTAGSGALVMTALLGAAAPAVARPKDAQARKLDESAMNEDFLDVSFDRGAEKLRRAIKECGGRGCETKLKAELHIHLGILLVNAGKRDAAVIAFTEGLKTNPSAVVDRDFVTPEIEAAFAAASEKVAPKRQTKDDKDPASAGSLKHEAVTEAPLNTPLPIWVEDVPSAAKYLLIYQPPEGAGWTKIRMKKMGKGWGTQIPCSDTDDAGTLAYYVVAEDADGDPIASSGSKKSPHSVEIKESIAGDAPSFPGDEPPHACKAGDTCPPGSEDPACGTGALAEGSKCTGRGQCNKTDGLACIEGSCQVGDEDDGPDSGAKNWLTLGVSLDSALISASSLCSPGHSASYTCVRTDGRYYKPDGATDTGTLGGPPFLLGTVRVLAGYDRIVSGNLAAGVRVGYAFRGGPDLPIGRSLQSFLPWHFEPRLTYWIGDDVLTHVGFRPFAFLGGGIGEVDAKITGVPVSNDCDLQGLCKSPRTPQALAFNPDSTPRTHADGSFVYVTQHGVDASTLPAKKSSKTNVDIYRRMGPAFVGLGGGVMYAFDRNTGLTLDLKLSYFFGSAGVALSPTLGGIYGF